MNTVTPRTRTGESCGNQALNVEDKMFGLSKIKFLALLAVVLIVAASVAAFAASNTVATSTAGEGKTAITGYSIENVKYVYNENPITIDSVEFKVVPVPTTAALADWVKVSLIATPTSGSWHVCATVTANNFSCATTENTADAVNLDVVASANSKP